MCDLLKYAMISSKNQQNSRLIVEKLTLSIADILHLL